MRSGVPDRNGTEARPESSERTDDMKSKFTRMLRATAWLALCLSLSAAAARAQQPTPQPSPSQQKSADAKSKSSAPKAGDDAGDYTVTSSIELGVRGLRVGGDINKYQSDLNYKSGVRLFDTSFLLKAKEGKKGGLFDTLLVTSTGWGADPYGHVRVSAENSKWYRFDGQYRRFRYFNFLNNIANPNFATQPTNPATGEHGYDTRQQLGDFDLTILPKNEKLRFNVGFSPERYSGPAFSTYHIGGDDFMLLSNLRSRSNDFRVGADWKLGPVNFSLLQGFRRFREDSSVDNNYLNLGANPAATNALLTSFHRNDPARGSVNYTRFSAHTLLAKKLDMTGRIIYSSATSNQTFVESFTGANWNTRITGLPSTFNPPNTLTLGRYSINGNTKRPNTLGDFGVTYLATDKLRISNTFRVETFQINGGDFYTARFNVTRANGTVLAPVIVNNGGNPFVFNEVTKYRKIQNTVEADYQFNDRYAAHFGYRYGTRRIEEFKNGFGLNANLPAALAPTADEETNHTNAFFGGFKARPVKEWTVYFDAEHGIFSDVLVADAFEDTCVSGFCLFEQRSFEKVEIQMGSRFVPVSRARAVAILPYRPALHGSQDEPVQASAMLRVQCLERGGIAIPVRSHELFVRGLHALRLSRRVGHKTGEGPRQRRHRHGLADHTARNEIAVAVVVERYGLGRTGRRAGGLRAAPPLHERVQERVLGLHPRVPWPASPGAQGEEQLGLDRAQVDRPRRDRAPSGGQVRGGRDHARGVVEG